MSSLSGKVFLFLLGLTYIGIGVYIFSKKILESPWSEILSIMFVVYGLWRVYRSIMKK
ncbi:MAG: hypothetical protein IPP15_20885 [Saprospiraceae bacterium]|uniref:Uncharacterized protein n=1 Tax=Candidatus Opimibacter skivensis TaxID=2982028 RepID=A0A9D7T043_9BACT|nr:hypothetical protein [Candidatus Opimibacter skivensis]